MDMTAFKTLAIAAVAAVLCCSCTKEKHFDPDPYLLEAEVADKQLGISYCMPAGFMPIRQDIVEAWSAQEQSYDPFSGKIAAVYVDTLLNFAVAKLTDMTSVPGERTENKLDFYFSEFNPNKEWDKVEIQRYRFGDFPKVVQLDMYNADKYYIKLFFYNQKKAYFSVDFYFDAYMYNDLLPFIESSIGSFKHYLEVIISTDVDVE